ASALFIIGLFGVMIRRNLLFVLLSIMIMMNGAMIAFIAADHHWQQLDGQIISLLVIIVALAQACVGLALLLQFYQSRKTLNIDSLSEMKG
ncbi:MAG: NADH-quinone oxidoreductase subunit NuoK, partial [Candidatus Schmidhempelia sp.]|nr:NADH-quinone oxidoreductase subunit NuoK [Candidatus Schmidhempelia sp.]